LVGLSDRVYRYYERRLAAALPRQSMPRHIGVILDGHRRFAREEGFGNYQASYRAGMAKLEELLGWCADLRINAVSGSLDFLPARLALGAKEAVARAGDGGKLHVNIALCYGGRQEIVDACRALVGDLAAEGVSPSELPEAIDAQGIARHLYAADLPDTDLVIRTSGESRLSGFLLWQSAYAEFAFVDPYWPAFRRVDLLRALRDYARRQRRFGT
jgi:short-chain Z-isoprenyl diphosphate synthase